MAKANVPKPSTKVALKGKIRATFVRGFGKCVSKKRTDLQL